MFGSVPSDLLRPPLGYDSAAPAGLNGRQEGVSGADGQGRAVSQQRPPENGSLLTLLETRLRQGPNRVLVGALLDAVREMPGSEAAERNFVVKMLEGTGDFRLTSQEKALVLAVYDKQVRQK
ncbi:hypothetical protein ACUSIJ_09285 [Pseudochelatococcus sp. B33]